MFITSATLHLVPLLSFFVRLFNPPYFPVPPPSLLSHVYHPLSTIFCFLFILFTSLLIHSPFSFLRWLLPSDFRLFLSPLSFLSATCTQLDVHLTGRIFHATWNFLFFSLLLFSFRLFILQPFKISLRRYLLQRILA